MMFYLKGISIKAIFDKWVIWAIISLFIVITGCGKNNKTPVTPKENNPTNNMTSVTVTFVDSSLEAAVRFSLGKPVGLLTEEDLYSLTKLEAMNADIIHLDGIAQLKNLKILDLSNNQIQNIASLASLVQLQFLDLSGNQVRDVSSLADLDKLETLVLEYNLVSDLGPLLELSALRSLELTGNPLDRMSQDQYLVDLRERGIEIGFTINEDTEEAEESELIPDIDIPGRIVFCAKTDHNQGNFDVFILDPKQFQLLQVTNDLDDEYEPVWSPDGTRIAFVRGDKYGDIYVADVSELGGHNFANITDGEGDSQNPSWSPDGTKIAFSHSSPNQYKNIFIIDLDGKNWIQLTSSKWDDLYPSWSPDGRQIAFISKREDGRGKQQIFIMDADGNNMVQLTDEDEFGDNIRPSWSPDGKRIVFEAFSFIIETKELNGPWIFSIFADGTGRTYHGEGSSPSWVLDETKLLLVGYSKDEMVPDIFFWNLLSGNMVNLTKMIRDHEILNVNVNRDPSWTLSDW